MRSFTVILASCLLALPAAAPAHAGVAGPAPRLDFSALFGGSDDEYAGAVTVDRDGNIYVAGSTKSANFPAVHALDATNNGDSDAFVAKFSADGSTLLYATFLGGSGVDFG